MAKYAAFGTVLYRGTSGGGTAIAQIRSISGPSLAGDVIDVTSHDSTAAWEEVVIGILRSGSMTLEIEYDPADTTQYASAGGLIADLVGRASTTYTLVFPDSGSTEWVFSAFVTGFEPSAPHDADLTATANMKLSGQPTLA